MFGVGDTVLYGTQGVCKIAGTEQKRIRGEYVDYLVLRPIYDETSTIFVPKNNETLLAKMRAVLSKEEIYEMIRDMPDEDTIWIEDDNLRKQQYQQIISDGDRRKLVKLIKTLHLHRLSQEEKGRHLHQADEVVLKQAEKLLHDEFALVLNIRPDEVLPFILEQTEAV